jgi:hypothetical protein
MLKSLGLTLGRLRILANASAVNCWRLGQVFNFEAIVIMAPLTTGKHLFGYFFDGEVGEFISFAPKVHAQHQQGTVCADFVGELGELVVAKEKFLFRVIILLLRYHMRKLPLYHQHNFTHTAAGL